jgi:hypothetical protein
MPTTRPSLSRFRPSLSFVLLVALVVALWVAGGGSRADNQGQAVVRGVSAAVIIALVLFGDRPRIANLKAVWVFLLAIIALPLLQLVRSGGCRRFRPALAPVVHIA